MKKKLSLKELRAFCKECHDHGKKVVLCHGVFDVLHVGHIRHLDYAKKNGDILVVTVTGDDFVNKGPDRPVFPSDLRLEMLASLGLVDRVTTIEEPSALSAIEVVRPDIYVKGKEYIEKDDITGKITSEAELVEKYGGAVVYTDDIVFSSSNLINNHMNMIAEPVRAFLNQIKEDDGEYRVSECLSKIGQLKILIVGETIIDSYHYVSPMGKAAKENIIATLFSHEENFAGGAIAAANHLASICDNVEVLTMLGDPNLSEDHYDFVRAKLDEKVGLDVVTRPNGPTVLKRRFVEPTYVRKLFEVYNMDDSPLPDSTQKVFHKKLQTKVNEADLVIICDFGHGFMDSKACRIVEKDARFLAINTQSNSGNLGYNLASKYKRADFLCIDAPEARLVTNSKHVGLDEIVAKILPQEINGRHFMITHGKHGCYTYSTHEKESMHIPALKHNVVDTVGAGDAFFVIASTFLAVGADTALAGFLGNVAGGIKVGIVGHSKSIGKLELQRSVVTLLK